MKDWTWQKWLGKLAVLVVAVAEAVFALLEVIPVWWPAIATGIAWLVQFVIGLIPPKEPVA